MQTPAELPAVVRFGPGPEETVMEENKMLSVIIPVYNASAYIGSGLDNLIATLPDKVEILLVDDGSTDDSGKICRAYAERYSFVRYYYQSNSGPSAARNRGLREAAGEYISFLDADDLVDAGAYFWHASGLSGSAADIRITDFERISDRGCVLDRVYQIDESPAEIRDGAYLERFLSAPDCVWNVWRCFFRRAFLLENELFFAEGYSIAEDLEFMVRALTKAEVIIYSHRPFYGYRVNYGSSLTRRYSAERVRQLMDMLSAAAGHLDMDERCHRLLGGKIAREYILNLSLLYELPKAEREAALGYMKNKRHLAAMADGAAYRAVYLLTGIMGLRIPGYVLYRLKGLKRYARERKVRAHDRGQGWS